MQTQQKRHFEWFLEDPLLRPAYDATLLVAKESFSGRTSVLASLWGHASLLGALDNPQRGLSQTLFRALLADGAHRTSITVTTAMARCAENDFPVWQIDRELQQVLLNTQMPLETLPTPMPELPFPGLYVELLDSDIVIVDPTSGEHQIEGFYVFRDEEARLTIGEQFRRKAAGEDIVQDGDVSQSAWVLVGVGKVKGKNSLGGNDDTLRYWALKEGAAPLHWLRADEDADGACVAVTKMWVNLWYLWLTRHLQEKEVRPVLPKSPKKMKRAERRNESFHRYKTLSLNGLSTRAPRKGGEPSQRKPGARGRVVVPGFFRGYWVKDPKEEAVLDTRVNQKGTKLSKVARFIAPYVYGEGDSNPVWRIR